MTTRGRSYSWAAISCVHSPFCHAGAKESLLTALTNVGPFGPLTDFVLLGDLFESSAASVHPDEHGHTLADEYESAARYLEDISECLPMGVRLHWCLGNHDDNIQIPDSRRTDWRTRDLIHWNRSEYSDIFRKWKQYPYRKPSVHDQSGCLQLGQAIFCHGWDAGPNSDELEGLQMAWACGGHSHRLIVRGHTHRPREVTQCKRSAKVLLPWHVANVGTMGPLQPQYMARKDVSHWGAAIAWGRGRVNTPSRFAGKEWESTVQRI